MSRLVAQTAFYSVFSCFNFLHVSDLLIFFELSILAILTLRNNKRHINRMSSNQQLTSRTSEGNPATSIIQMTCDISFRIMKVVVQV